jgi:hypothetical protein
VLRFYSRLRHPPHPSMFFIKYFSRWQNCPHLHPLAEFKAEHVEVGVSVLVGMLERRKVFFRAPAQVLHLTRSNLLLTYRIACRCVPASPSMSTTKTDSNQQNSRLVHHVDSQATARIGPRTWRSTRRALGAPCLSAITRRRRPPAVNWRLAKKGDEHTRFSELLTGGFFYFSLLVFED